VVGGRLRPWPGVRAWLGAGLAAAVLATGAPEPAEAASTRVSISDFRWSKEPTIDLGEKVIWDWIGPDTAHSVTGQAPNATQWDSDFGISQPLHRGGDSYEVTFDQPGEYLFVCKLHSSVRGTVTVTDRPGDPNSDPGPQPPIDLDAEPPLVERVRLGHEVLGPRGRGTVLRFEVGERGTASVDYYRLIRRGRKRKARTVRRFAGFLERPVHIGLNSMRFARRSAGFRARPGRYVAFFRVDDESFNSSRDFRLRFEIRRKPRTKR